MKATIISETNRARIEAAIAEAEGKATVRCVGFDMDRNDRLICATIARLADTIQDLIGQIHDKALFEDMDEAFRAYFEMEGEY